MFKNIGKNAKTAGLGIVGGFGGKFVKNKLVPMVPGIGDNPYAQKLAPVVVGLFLMESKNSMLQDIGSGMVITAGADFVAEKMPGISALTGDDYAQVAANVLDGIDDEIDEIMKRQTINDAFLS